ncbi:MAG: hypothetical protein LC721_00180 [Actinobacteria bacterium]|nr:hypothetical protein [Actinomycetota bacterium]
MDTKLAVAHAECVPEIWAPDLDNAPLKDAALGLGNLATTPRPPRCPAPLQDREAGTPVTPYAPR